MSDLSIQEIKSMSEQKITVKNKISYVFSILFLVATILIPFIKEHIPFLQSFYENINSGGFRWFQFCAFFNLAYVYINIQLHTKNKKLATELLFYKNKEAENANENDV